VCEAIAIRRNLRAGTYGPLVVAAAA
jgi:hypothetical protein